MHSFIHSLINSFIHYVAGIFYFAGILKLKNNFRILDKEWVSEWVQCSAVPCDEYDDEYDFDNDDDEEWDEEYEEEESEEETEEEEEEDDGEKWRPDSLADKAQPSYTEPPPFSRL